MALLAFPVWHYWGFQHVPDFLRQMVNAMGTRLGYVVDFQHRKIVYASLWFTGVMLWRLWELTFRHVYAVILAQRTTLQFTPTHVELYRGLGWRVRRYDRRAAEITFLIIPPANLAWLVMKAREKGRRGARRAVFYEQLRYLYLVSGMELIPVAGFVSPDAAQRFSAVCQFANSYRLSTNREKTNSHNQPRLESTNVADI